MMCLAEYTANKARSAGMATGALIICGHTGRIGAYAETIARQGCFALIILCALISGLGDRLPLAKVVQVIWTLVRIYNGGA